jgi:hypothetical protein
MDKLFFSYHTPTVIVNLIEIKAVLKTPENITFLFGRPNWSLVD